MSLEALEEHYLEQKRKGMDNSEIRTELRYKGLSSEELTKLVLAIDNRFLDGKKRRGKPDNRNYRSIVGLLLIILGSVVTIGTYTGFVPINNTFIFAYGPILGGLAMIAASKRRRTIFHREKKGKWRKRSN